MKIEKIDANHIKITVDSLDFEIFNIELSSLTPDSPQLHTFLFSMMQQAQHETGFNPYNGQILIEAVPGKNNIVFLISRIDADVPKPPRKVYKYKDKTFTVSVKHNSADNPPVKSDVSIHMAYRFDSFANLEQGISMLTYTLLRKGAVYKMDDSYYLIFSLNDIERTKDSINAKLSEFCVPLGCKRNMKDHLQEHAILVAKGVNLVKFAKLQKS